jgi:hypothetical protein
MAGSCARDPRRIPCSQWHVRGSQDGAVSPMKKKFVGEEREKRDVRG